MERQSPKQRIYYRNNVDNEVYRILAIGYTKDTGEKRVILRKNSDGTDWDIAWKDLFDVCLVKGNITSVWEKLPNNYYTDSDEKPYQGYTNDPRPKEVHDGYNAFGQPIRTKAKQSYNFDRRY